MTEYSGLFPVPAAFRRPLFCGPVALAAITARPLATIEAAVRKHRLNVPPPRRQRRDVIRTMWNIEIEPVAALLGWRAIPIELPPRPTSLGDWRAPAGYPCLVLVTGHFLAVAGGLYVDTGRRVPTPLILCPHLRREVQWVWVMEREQGHEPQR